MIDSLGTLAPLWGFLPFIIILGSLIITAILFAILWVTSKLVLPAEVVAEILFAMGSILLGVMLVLAIMRVGGCGRVTPYEMFTDQQNQQGQGQSQSINDLEVEVCKQLHEVLVFKQSDLGQKAIDNPAVLADAIHAMIQAAGGPITECTPPLSTITTSPTGTSIQPLSPTGIPVSDDMFQTHPDEIADRLDRAFRTLKFVVEPQALATFTAMDTCGNGSYGSVGTAGDQPETLQDQLNACVSLAATIRSRYLTPIAQKQADLRAGRLSDCDRQKGAAVGSSH